MFRGMGVGQGQGKPMADSAADMLRELESKMLALSVEKSKKVGATPPSASGSTAATEVDDVYRRLQAIRRVLMGEPEGAAPAAARISGNDAAAVSAAAVEAGSGPASAAEADALASEALTGDFLSVLVTRLPALNWEGRKEAVLVWTTLVTHGDDADDDQAQHSHHSGNRNGARDGQPDRDEDEEDDEEEEDEDGGERGRRRRLGPGLLYLESNLHLIDALMRGYENMEIAIQCGLMLRETLRSQTITRHLLEAHGLLEILFTSCDVPSFDVASDAFTTLKDLLRKHPHIAADFLIQNFERFFDLYQRLLMSDTYVTRRQSLKLLGEILLDRANSAAMLRFIAESHNLKLIMTLLKDSTKSIQCEAFHVFKVFVANPRKPYGIIKLLVRNREKLIKFLKAFEMEKEDEDFEEERDMLIAELDGLELPPAPPA